MQAQTPEVSAAKATTPSADLRLVSVEQLKKIHRDLDACQKVIWLAGCRPRGYGFDPAYVTDAQARLAEIEALVAQQEPAPAQDEREAPEVVAVLYKSGDVLTAEECGIALEVCAKVETPLMTVAQHERIVASLTRPAQTEQPAAVIGFYEGEREPRLLSWNALPNGEHHLYSRPAQTEQQPVAWGLPDRDKDAPRPFVLLVHDLSQVSQPEDMVPLYAAPIAQAEQQPVAEPAEPAPAQDEPDLIVRVRNRNGEVMQAEEVATSEWFDSLPDGTVVELYRRPAQTEQPTITLSVPQKPGTYLLATGYVGNALLFWRRGGRGYTTNVAEAEVYDEAVAVRMFGARAFEDVPWPVEALSTGYRVVTGPEYMDRDAVRRCCEQQAVWRAGISKGDVK